MYDFLVSCENLFTKEIIQDKDWALLESQCKKLVETINKIK